MGSVIQAVEHALRSTFPHTNFFERRPIHEIRAMLGGTVAATVRRILNERWVNIPNQESWASSFLFVGHVPEGSFILEVHDNLTDTNHIGTGFAAIGSGDIFPYFAMAELAHFQVKARPLREVKLIAYRIIEDPIHVAAFGLGEPIQVIQLEQCAAGAGVATRVPEEQLRVLRDKVVEWKQVENEALSTFVGLGGVVPEQAELPEDDASRPAQVPTAGDASVEGNPL